MGQHFCPGLAMHYYPLVFTFKISRITFHMEDSSGLGFANLSSTVLTAAGMTLLQPGCPLLTSGVFMMRANTRLSAEIREH